MKSRQVVGWDAKKTLLETERVCATKSKYLPRPLCNLVQEKLHAWSIRIFICSVCNISKSDPSWTYLHHWYMWFITDPRQKHNPSHWCYVYIRSSLSLSTWTPSRRPDGPHARLKLNPAFLSISGNFKQKNKPWLREWISVKLSNSYGMSIKTCDEKFTEKYLCEAVKFRFNLIPIIR